MIVWMRCVSDTEEDVIFPGVGVVDVDKGVGDMLPREADWIGVYIVPLSQLV